MLRGERNQNLEIAIQCGLNGSASKARRQVNVLSLIQEILAGKSELGLPKLALCLLGAIYIQYEKANLLYDSSELAIKSALVSETVSKRNTIAHRVINRQNKADATTIDGDYNLLTSVDSTGAVSKKVREDKDLYALLNSGIGSMDTEPHASDTLSSRLMKTSNLQETSNLFNFNYLSDYYTSSSHKEGTSSDRQIDFNAFEAKFGDALSTVPGIKSEYDLESVQGLDENLQLRTQLSGSGKKETQIFEVDKIPTEIDEMDRIMQGISAFDYAADIGSVGMTGVGDFDGIGTIVDENQNIYKRLTDTLLDEIVDEVSNSVTFDNDTMTDENASIKVYETGEINVDSNENVDARLRNAAADSLDTANQFMRILSDKSKTSQQGSETSNKTDENTSDKNGINEEAFTLNYEELNNVIDYEAIDFQQQMAEDIDAAIEKEQEQKENTFIKKSETENELTIETEGFYNYFGAENEDEIKPVTRTGKTNKQQQASKSATTKSMISKISVGNSFVSLKQMLNRASENKLAVIRQQPNQQMRQKIMYSQIQKQRSVEDTPDSYSYRYIYGNVIPPVIKDYFEQNEESINCNSGKFIENSFIRQKIYDTADTLLCNGITFSAMDTISNISNNMESNNLYFIQQSLRQDALLPNNQFIDQNTFQVTNDEIWGKFVENRKKTTYHTDSYMKIINNTFNTHITHGAFSIYTGTDGTVNLNVTNEIIPNEIKQYFEDIQNKEFLEMLKGEKINVANLDNQPTMLNLDTNDSVPKSNNFKLDDTSSMKKSNVIENENDYAQEYIDNYDIIPNEMEYQNLDEVQPLSDEKVNENEKQIDEIDVNVDNITKYQEEEENEDEDIGQDETVVSETYEIKQIVKVLEIVDNPVVSFTELVAKTIQANETPGRWGKRVTEIANSVDIASDSKQFMEQVKKSAPLPLARMFLSMLSIAHLNKGITLQQNSSFSEITIKKESLIDEAEE